MRFIRPSLGAGLIAIAVLLNGCNAADERDRSILNRLSGALSERESPWLTYLKISDDPEASAKAAATRRDYRLIAYSVTGMLDVKPYFPGVNCTIPSDLEPILQRTLLTNLNGDGPSLSKHYDPRVAERYNRALLAEPTFPHGDLCAAVGKQNLDEPEAEGRTTAVPYFSRLSGRLAQSVSEDDKAAVLIRNGRVPLDIASMELDYPDSFGLTPLAWAAMRGQRALVMQLLAKGADPWVGARCYVPPGKQGDIFYDDRLLTPLGLASQAGRSDMVELMLEAVPQKHCLTRPEGATTADAELKLMLDMGRAISKSPQQHRKLLANALRQSSDFPQGYEQNSPFKLLIEHSLTFKITDVFRSLSEEQAAQKRKDLLEMAAAGSRDDLEYWVNRFDVKKSDEMADMLYGITRNMTYICANDCNWDGDKKLSWLLDRIGHPSGAESATIIYEVFGENLGPLDRDPASFRRIFGMFVKHGYNFNVGMGCTLILQSLAYSREECPNNAASPAFAQLLLDLGVDVKSRTPSGLTALDLAERRTNNGPYSAAFLPIAAQLRERGVPESRRPPTH